MNSSAWSRAALWLAAPWLLSAQAVDFQQQGYVEYRAFGFPDTTYNDRGHFIGEAIIHYDVMYGLAPGWKLNGGTETRSDTHRQTEREFRLNIDERGLKRPNFSIRHISLSFNRGPFTMEAGKQYIRWGKTAILSPTDRFAPRDYLAVVDNDALAVPAARLKLQTATDNLEIVLQPFFTPSRMPLLNQRWTVLPEHLRAVHVNDLGSRIPGGTQWGVRWNHAARNYEASLSFFDGRNHLPLLDGAFRSGALDFQRFYPRMQMYGGTLAIPLHWARFTAESAYFTSATREADEYVLYVLQLGRDTAKWSVSAGYAGEAITEKRNHWRFAPDRGLADALLGRAAYKIGATRSAQVEAAARGDGLWMRSQYSESWGKYWSGSAGFTLLRGKPTDFLGQYRRNSFFNLSLRYSFD